jgi:hypothetical protein
MDLYIRILIFQFLFGITKLQLILFIVHWSCLVFMIKIMRAFQIVRIYI